MTTTQSRPAPSPAATPRRWRGDVEGLRAVAVGLVLAYHAGLGPSGGFIGVDVFFVVSGFVITTQVVREVERSGRLSLVGFYARRAKRLLPAAGLVLLTTAVLTWFLAPRTQRGTFGLDIAGAAGYVVNWVFAGRSVDYLAEDLEPSPVLHFWSLAVEEQFYIVWPLAIILVLLLRRRFGWSSTRLALAVGLGLLIILPTFVWSLVLTAEDPARAFFVTTTRLWEMGLGAFVALGANRWARLPERLAAVLGWVGLAALALAALTYDGTLAWPGYAAVLPTLATAVVIVAGFRAHRTGPEVLLGTRPLRWVGGLSYSLYLWHWPVLRAFEWVLGPLSAVTGTLAVLVSFVPAYLSFRFVENPLRRHPWLGEHPRRALGVGAAISVAGLVVGLGMWAATSSQADDRGARTDAGFTSLTTPPGRDSYDAEPFFSTLTPTAQGATADVPSLYAQGCQTEVEVSTPKPCTAGDPKGSLSVAVVGDSKVAQWVPAVDAIGQERGWKVTSWTKSSCPFVDATVPYQDAPYDACRTWGQEVLKRLTGPDKPDVVITSSVYSTAYDASGTATPDAYRAGLVATWTALEDAGVRVVALSNTPNPPSDLTPVYECVAQHPDDRAACSWPYEQSPGSAALEAAAKSSGASWVDMDPWVCPGGECAGIYRNVLTYRQGSHITGTFVRILQAPLEERLAAVVDRP
ncbi:acyltransferase [Phycicoccus sp. MAQZ13P-2]|uniref:acyltransferase family protein n=1 Tax=Phycicoccus mangrovi TaxID=2840470 RepID=UPI001C0088FD|nr:acyltransferase family protein [Phycicoccus mangrovi]MBT9255963.1 acyltransferase [Phycicoccus mangrovi]MBT9274557.1 acyltransferase [Phycicoccus mangrovi]